VSRLFEDSAWVFRLQPRLHRSASRVLDLASIDRADDVWMYWFLHASSSLMRYARYIWTLRISVITPLAGERSPACRSALGCTSETELSLLISVLVSQSLRLCSALTVTRPASPKWISPDRDRASREVRAPLAASLSEVRYTWDFHPQHLPPLGFLNPSTVCSFRKLARFVSYEHHLWGSKCKRAWLLALCPSACLCPSKVHPKTVFWLELDTWTCRRPKPSAHGDIDSTELLSFPNWCDLLGSRRHVTHLAARKHEAWEEGASTTELIVPIR